MTIDPKNYAGPDRVVSFEELLEAGKDAPKGFRVNTQFPALDKMIDGMEEGELVTITGPTGCGKSLLAQTLHRNFYKQGKRVEWFSFEMRNEQFLRRYPQLPEGYAPLMHKESGTSATLDWVFDKMAESKAKYNTSIAIIDHLHYLFSLTGQANVSLLIGEVVQRLCNYAIDNGWVIILLAHIGKVDPTRKELEIGDIRDSSFIAQFSSTVLMVWRVPDKPEQRWYNHAFLKVVKARREGTMNKKFKLHYKDGWLEEWEDPEPDFY